MATINISPTISIAENPENDREIATLTVNERKEGETFTYSLGEGLDDYFWIDGDKLLVKNGALFNFESALKAFELEIFAESEADVDPTIVEPASVTINVTDVNEAPADIIVTGGTIPENTAIGADVAFLAAVDQDAGETFTYSLVDVNGTAITSPFFGIVDNKITLKAGLDNAQVGSHTLYVKVTDGDLSYVVGPE